MASHRAPKQWSLTKSETVNSFENWRQNLQYVLSLDPNFAPFLVSGMTWQKKGRTNTTRGLANDPDTISAPQRRTAQQKVTHLELMLGQIANYCPIISRKTITHNSVSIDSIWQTIRAHFGFQSTGAQFLNLSDMKLEQDERPEDLYQRLTAFFEDNLLTTNGGLKHQGQIPTEDEDMTPSLENVIVLLWLQLIHKDLPRLVKQRYGTELRSQTLASIKPEISQALQSLLDELRSSEEARVLRSSNFYPVSQRPSASWQPRRDPALARSQRRPTPSCILCKQASRPSTHYLSQCSHLPLADKKFLTKARLIAALDEDDINATLDDLDLDDVDNQPLPPNIPASRRVQIGPSPFLNVFYDHHPLKITIDSGAETNMIKAAIATQIGAHITTSSQIALQADGQSPLDIIGETKLTVTRDNHTFFLEALVVQNIDVDVLAGVPFMAHNDITVRPAKHHVILSDNTIYCYGSESRAPGPHAIRLTTAVVLRAPNATTTIWPGDYLEVDSPPNLDPSQDHVLAVEPRIDTATASWPSPFLTTAIAGKIRLPNTTQQPLIIKKNSHVAQVCTVYTPYTPSPLP